MALDILLWALAALAVVYVVFFVLVIIRTRKIMKDMDK